MFRALSCVVAGLGLCAALICYDPNVPMDAEDYWYILNIEKMDKWSRLMRFIFGGPVVKGSIPDMKAPVDPDINNFKTQFDGVDVRIYDPVARGSDGLLGPVLIYIHGGGWVLGDIDSYDLTTYDISKLLPSFLVVSVDYRRAPQNPFPAALEDVDKVYRFLIAHQISYKIDVNRIVVAGDSAGGNLAAAYCLKLRDANRKSQPEDVIPMPKLQALIYPALQAVDFKTPSCQGQSPFLTPTIMAALSMLYLTGSEEGHEYLVNNAHQGNSKVREAASRYVKHSLVPQHLIQPSYSTAPSDTQEVDLPPNLAAKIDIISSNPYFSPLIADDLTDLPRAYIIACQYDVLRDDAILYGRRLSAAGVETETRVDVGAWHGIMFRLSYLNFKKGEAMTAEMCKYIKDTV